MSKKKTTILGTYRSIYGPDAYLDGVIWDFGEEEDEDEDRQQNMDPLLERFNLNYGMHACQLHT